MDNAPLYNTAKKMQIKDADDIIKQNLHLVRWKPDAHILDVGCGDGDITANFLMSRIPASFKTLVGVDISPKMVEYANFRYRTSDRIDFRVMDITSTDIEKAEIGKYDHVFSFNCLHWIQDQYLAFKNIYEMMKEDGDMLVCFGAKNDIYSVYETLAKNPKWKKYKKDVQKYVSPYHHMKDPEKTLELLLSSIGYKNIQIQYKLKVYYFYDLKSLKNAVMAVNPFIPRMPVELHDDYFEDYLKEVRKLNLIDEGNNNDGESLRIKSPYRSMVVYATK